MEEPCDTKCSKDATSKIGDLAKGREKPVSLPPLAAVFLAAALLSLVMGPRRLSLLAALLFAAVLTTLRGVRPAARTRPRRVGPPLMEARLPHLARGTRVQLLALLRG